MRAGAAADLLHDINRTLALLKAGVATLVAAFVAADQLTDNTFFLYFSRFGRARSMGATRGYCVRRAVRASTTPPNASAKPTNCTGESVSRKNTNA